MKPPFPPMPRFAAVICLLVLPLLLASCHSRVSIPQDTIAWKDFPDALAEKRIVVIGESHALVEPVETVEYLVSQTGNKTRFTHLVVEWPDSHQPALDEFMAGNEDPWKQMIAGSAGLPGSTAEYFSLYSFVRDFNRAHPGSPVQVYLMDVKAPVRNTASEDRDQHMFQHIRRILDADPKNRVLVYCGWGHAAGSGAGRYPANNGGNVLLPTLGHLLASAYPGEMCSAVVLSHYDPGWHSIGIGTDRTDTVFRPDERSGDMRECLKPDTWWQPGPQGEKVSKVFDYLIWHPRSTPGRRIASTRTVEDAAPVVVRTEPESGSKDVAPGEVEIRVTFSKQMMDQSWSPINLRDNPSPQIVGKPQYDTGCRTWTMKVKLEPGKTYGFWLNDQDFSDFKDVQGHSAVPYLLIFKTKSQ